MVYQLFENSDQLPGGSGYVKALSISRVEPREITPENKRFKIVSELSSLPVLKRLSSQLPEHDMRGAAGRSYANDSPLAANIITQL